MRVKGDCLRRAAAVIVPLLVVLFFPGGAANPMPLWAADAESRFRLRVPVCR